MPPDYRWSACGVVISVLRENRRRHACQPHDAFAPACSDALPLSLIPRDAPPLSGTTTRIFKSGTITGDLVKTQQGILSGALTGSNGNNVLTASTGAATIGPATVTFRAAVRVPIRSRPVSGLKCSLSRWRFFGSGVVAGTLSASAFEAGTTSLTTIANVRLIHRGSDNTIWCDDEGNGLAAAVLIANIAVPVAGRAISATGFPIF